MNSILSALRSAISSLAGLFVNKAYAPSSPADIPSSPQKQAQPSTSGGSRGTSASQSYSPTSNRTASVVSAVSNSPVNPINIISKVFAPKTEAATGVNVPYVESASSLRQYSSGGSLGGSSVSTSSRNLSDIVSGGGGSMARQKESPVSQISLTQSISQQKQEPQVVSPLSSLVSPGRVLPSSSEITGATSGLSGIGSAGVGGGGIVGQSISGEEQRIPLPTMLAQLSKILELQGKKSGQVFIPEGIPLSSVLRPRRIEENI